VLLDVIVLEGHFGKVNSEDAELTLASHCVIN
jgi:Histone deacetylase domain